MKSSKRLSVARARAEVVTLEAKIAESRRARAEMTCRKIAARRNVVTLEARIAELKAEVARQKAAEV